MMQSIKYSCIFLCLLAPCIASAEDDDENKPQLINHQLNCNVYGYGGEKTVVSGDIILLDRNARSPRELLVMFTDSSRPQTVKSAKALWADDGSFHVAEKLASLDTDYRSESVINYDFHWVLSGSYVIISRTSCLQCVALRHNIVGTGVCDIHQVQVDELPK